VRARGIGQPPPRIYSRIWTSDVLTPVWSRKFKRDVRRVEKRGKDMEKLKAVLSLLIEEMPLPPNFRDHPLKGEG
jgi:mRNA interferase YafQ